MGITVQSRIYAAHKSATQHRVDYGTGYCVLHPTPRDFQDYGDDGAAVHDRVRTTVSNAVIWLLFMTEIASYCTVCVVCWLTAFKADTTAIVNRGVAGIYFSVPKTFLGEETFSRLCLSQNGISGFRCR